MQRIKEIRESRGLTQAELASKSGVRQPAISDIETGVTRKPSADTIFRLAKALGCTMEELIAPEEVDQDDAGGAGGAAGIHSGDENRR